ncbi:hypothetical protein BLOT_006674, partial [Blomia tropicalis]
NEWVYHNPESNDSSLSSNNKGVCHFEDRNYLEGQRIPVKNSCIHCFCDRGRSKCYRQNCPPPPVGCRMVVNTDSCHSSSYNCIGIASSSCLQCHCAKQSLLCIPLCCYEPIDSYTNIQNSMEKLFSVSIRARDPHPLEHLD